MSSRILVINDDQSILDLFDLILRDEGYEVNLSMLDYEDIKDVEHLHPDLIILDFKMGQHHAGWTLLEKLKLYRPTKDIHTIICTAALNEVREQEETLRQKGIPVVYKPFEIEDLLQVIRQRLSPTSL